MHFRTMLNVSSAFKLCLCCVAESECRTDVFTAMCVLCILERMDDGKRALINESVCNESGEDCHRVGFGFLQAASLSSLLAARYVSILQQLHGGHSVERMDASMKDNSIPTSFSHYGSSHDSLVVTYPQDNIGRWAFGSDDPISQSDFDFANIDDLFFSTGLLGDNTIGSMGTQIPAAYMGW